MEENYWTKKSSPNPQRPPDEEEKEPAGTSGIVVQQYNGIFYLWKIITVDQPYPQEGKDALSSIVSKFIIKFFSLSRADTKGLETLSSDLIHTLRRLVKNIKLNDREVILKLEDEFNKFHYEITNLQSEKTQEIITHAKSTFTFKKVHERFLIPDLDLEYEENIFRNKMFSCETFTADMFGDEFISVFKNFIIGFNPVTETGLRNSIEHRMQDFNHKFELFLAQTKKNISSYLEEIINSISPMRLSIMMYQIPTENEETNINKWEVVYERMLDKEEVELKQVVRLMKTHALITLSFKSINKLLVVEDLNFETRIIPELLPDDSTIFADGSEANALIAFHNKEKQAFMGCLDREVIIRRNGLIIYKNDIEEVRSAAYVISKEEVFIINQAGVFSNFSVKDRQVTPLSQIVPTDYRMVTVSECERFIVLLSSTETYVFTSGMELVYMDHSRPFYADINGIEVYMVFMDNPRNISVMNVQMENEALVNLPEPRSREHRVDSEVRRTIRLGQELIKGFLGSSNFEGINAPNLVPK